MSTAVWLPKIGDKVDRYEVISEIARGGMAAVYGVRRRSFGGFGRVLAMKVLLPHLREEQQFIDMFLDEARLASSVHHPNVVQVFDLGREQDCPFLVMELVQGVSLSFILKKAKADARSVPLGVALYVLGQAAEGLHAAHETRGEDGQPLNIVHRDVSPHNILVGFDGHAKVTDFGIAAGRGRIASTKSSEVRGKLSYLAPEQVKRLHALDRRVDVWGLGVVAFELFAGKKLFELDDEATVLWEIVGGDPPNLERDLPHVPKALRETLASCLQRDRSSRLADCSLLRDAFLDAARELGCRGTPEVAAFVADLFPPVTGQSDEPEASEGAAPTDRDSRPPGEPASRDRLAASTKPNVVAKSDHTHTQVAVSSTFERPRVPGRTLVAMLALGGVAMISFGAYQLRKAPVEPVMVPATNAALSAPAPVVSSKPAPSPKLSVSVKVGDDVRILLVAGQVHAERPAVLELGPDGSVEVELVSKSGKIVRRVLRKADDGTKLTIQASRPSAEKPKSPLFSSPYEK